MLLRHSTGNCCNVYIGGANWHLECVEGCHCLGYFQWWHFIATWEGYSQRYDWRAQCECQKTREATPSVWVSLSMPYIVLPIAGAEVRGVFEGDFAIYAQRMTELDATSGCIERQTVEFGLRWFNNAGAADYRGRVDSIDSLTFSLELNASASNSLSIAVGSASVDALTLDEADFEWGYDCGKWFRADTATGNVDEWSETDTGRVSRKLTYGSYWLCE